MSSLVTLPVVVPLAGAAVSAGLHRWRDAQRAVAIVTLATVAAAGVALVAAAAGGEPAVAAIGGWPAPFGIPLVADGFAALLVTAAGAVGLVCAAYAITVADDDHRFFHPVVLVLVAGSCGAFLTGDLFNLFVFFEVTLVASYVLLTLWPSPGRLRAAAVYVPVNLLGSLVFLAGVALLYGLAGTLNMADLARAGVPPAAAVPGALLLVAFAVKAALVPLGGWLPLSYVETRPAIGGLFAGLLTTVGVAALYRTYLVVYHADPAFRPLLLALATVTMTVGAAGALAQPDLGRALTFVVMAQVGFMVLGAGLATAAGVAAGVFFIVQDLAVKAGAFLALGPLGDRREGRRWPGRTVFLVAGLSLAGLPLTSGFAGKVLLVRASVAEAHWVVTAAALLTSLAVLAALMRPWLRLLPAGGEKGAAGGVILSGLLVAVTVVAGMWPSTLLTAATAAADVLLHPSRYAGMVLG